MKKILLSLIVLSSMVCALEDITYNTVNYDDVGFNHTLINYSDSIIMFTDYYPLNLADGKKYSKGVWVTDCYYSPELQCYVNTETSLTECGKPLYPCIAQIITGIPLCITVLDLTPSLEDFMNDCFVNYSDQIYYGGWYNYECAQDRLNVSNDGLINDLIDENNCNHEYLPNGFNTGTDLCNKTLFHYVLQENITNNETVFSKAYVESFYCNTLDTTTTTTTTQGTTTTSQDTTTTSNEPPASTTTTTLDNNIYEVINSNGTPINNARSNVSIYEVNAESSANEYISLVAVVT